MYISEFNVNQNIILAEELKMEILGQLSTELVERLGFKDTIVIERKTYLNHNQKDLYIIEKNNSNYKLLLLGEGSVKKMGGSGIAVRIQSAKVNVLDVLKMVEYAVVNWKTLNKNLVKTDYFLFEGDKIQILANSEKSISDIVSNNSVLVDSLMQKEFVLYKDNSKIITWQDDEFIFKENLDRYQPAHLYAHISHGELKLQDFYYYVRNEIYNYFLVFSDKNTFSYFDGNEGRTATKMVIEKGSSFYPYITAKEIIYGKLVIYDDGNYFIYNVYKRHFKK
ncbi:hypothetical protein [Chryseobacterium caseinilyticum]|uniref:Uncharacterized protein n=1 Tax=Chryseobacterium caseinilyticum TaxID=2771428 RepID=A0ABR8ZI48_9FLAO|nr:hypothetical protein [Chryseobacterium caseinilyticum]MBD8084463.1 hypothetical protein [Chryseobacterium caseinilyticum]